MREQIVYSAIMQTNNVFLIFILIAEKKEKKKKLWVTTCQETGYVCQSKQLSW